MTGFDGPDVSSWFSVGMWLQLDPSISEQPENQNPEQENTFRHFSWKSIFFFLSMCKLRMQMKTGIWIYRRVFQHFLSSLWISAAGRSEDTFRDLRHTCRIFPGTSDWWSDGAENKRLSFLQAAVNPEPLKKKYFSWSESEAVFLSCLKSSFLCNKSEKSECRRRKSQQEGEREETLRG